MNMKAPSTRLALVFLAGLFAGRDVSAFVPTGRGMRLSPTVHEIHQGSWNALSRSSTTSSSLHQASKDDASLDNVSWFDGLTINPVYLIPYLGFLVFAVHATQSEALGASQAVLDQFLADPVHPANVNPLFATVFNLIGLIPIPLTCLLMPSAAQQRLPAAPFLAASAAMGYGALGPYVMTRQANTDDSVTQQDLGWFTANVWENKIFNWFMVAVSFSSLITTGVAAATTGR